MVIAGRRDFPFIVFLAIFHLMLFILHLTTDQLNTDQ